MIKILYIDDEPDLRELVLISLAADPRVMAHAADGAQMGLRLIDDWQPRLVLTDVKMPEMDGKALLLEIRKNPKHAGLPVVFLTASTNPETQAELLSLGATAVLEKPFDPLTLADRLVALARPE